MLYKNNTRIEYYDGSEPVQCGTVSSHAYFYDVVQVVCSIFRQYTQYTTFFIHYYSNCLHIIMT